MPSVQSTAQPPLVRNQRNFNRLFNQPTDRLNPAWLLSPAQSAVPANSRSLSHGQSAVSPNASRSGTFKPPGSPKNPAPASAEAAPKAVNLRLAPSPDVIRVNPWAVLLEQETAQLRAQPWNEQNLLDPFAH